MFNIVADENLAFPVELFSQFGNVELINGRLITKAVLKNADALIIRSVTQVNESLLEGTNVKFVGTATIGTDHLDIGYLKSKGITVVSSPGCNSYAVAEYVITSLINAAIKNNFSLIGKTIGVVGVGNVGSKVVSFCEAIGMHVLKNDPPLFRQGKLTDNLSFNDILDADIISFHVPLTYEGNDKTYHLLNENKLKLLNNNTILINTSRGSVIDEKDLIEFVQKKNLTLILDVWEEEPEINKKLAEQVFIGTPHIAGYTLEGKVNGSLMVYETLADYLGVAKSVHISLPLVSENKFDFDFSAPEDLALFKIIKNIYDVEEDHKKFLELKKLDKKEIGKYFDILRKDYPLRREFDSYSIKLKYPSLRIEKLLKDLRFNLSD